jgi:hypothetical protein
LSGKARTPRSSLPAPVLSRRRRTAPRIEQPRPGAGSPRCSRSSSSRSLCSRCRRRAGDRLGDIWIVRAEGKERSVGWRLLAQPRVRADCRACRFWRMSRYWPGHGWRSEGCAFGEIRAYLQTRPELGGPRRDRRVARRARETNAARERPRTPGRAVSGASRIRTTLRAGQARWRPAADQVWRCRRGSDENPGDSARPGSVRLACHSRRHITRPWWSRGAQTPRPATPSGMHACSSCASRSPAAAIQGSLVPTPILRA